MEVKHISLHRPAGLHSRGSLEIESSNGGTDSILLMEGMPLRQAGQLLINLGERLLRREPAEQTKDT